MRSLLLTITTTVAIALALAPAAAFGASGASKVLPPTAAPFGHTYSQWGALWWQWALAQPTSSNPIFDETGANCAQGQQGHVWFLAGSFSPSTTHRSCTVPAGTAFIVPVLNFAYFAFVDDPPETRTAEYVHAQAAAPFPATALSASVDNHEVDGLARYFENSTLFQVTLGPDNLFGLPDGFLLDPSADAGYYLAISPLPPGNHTIKFSGTNKFGFSLDVTYDITVAR